MYTQPVSHIACYYSDQARRWWHYEPMRAIIMMQRNLYQAMAREVKAKYAVRPNAIAENRS